MGTGGEGWGRGGKGGRGSFRVVGAPPLIHTTPHFPTLQMGMQTLYNFWAFPEASELRRMRQLALSEGTAAAEEDVQSFKRLRLSQVRVRGGGQGQMLGGKKGGGAGAGTEGGASAA